ncbi:MAG: M28 family metallopeptidase [Woeseiaceae bacterium]
MDRKQNARDQRKLQGAVMKKFALLVCIALVVVACGERADEVTVSEDDVLSTISKENVYTHVAYLADDALAGRLTGEPGHEKAAKYVADQFAAIGLEPGGTEGFYQQVPLQSYLIDTTTASLTVHRDGHDIPLTYRDDFTMGGDKVREQTSVSGELVYIGYGVHAPKFGYSDYAGVDVEGKILLGYSGGPDSIPGDELAYFSSSQTKYDEMVARGAVGWISLRSRRSAETYPWERSAKSTGTKAGMTWLDLSGNPDGYYPEVLGAASISPDAATALFEGTPISFEETRDKTEAATPASVPLGLEATIARSTIIDRLESPNVIAALRGSDPELADEYVIYTAHLDHVGVGVEVDGDDIYNGMYDNALGTAIMIEAARALAAAPPRRSILFIALTAEERGLLGSEYFSHYPTVPTDAIVANVNMDMPLFLFPASDLVGFGAEHSSLGPTTEAAVAAEGFVLSPDPYPEENIFRRSDQYSFVKKGVPAIYLDGGFGSTDPSVDGEAIVKEFLAKHYHQPSDDLSRPVDWDSVVRFTRAITRIGWGVANDDTRPTWNEGDFFGDMFAPKK